MCFTGDGGVPVTMGQISPTGDQIYTDWFGPYQIVQIVRKVIHAGDEVNDVVCVKCILTSDEVDIYYEQKMLT